jgi:hypothetical protein
MMTNYQRAKDMLRAHSEWAKAQFRSDKPAIRQVINDYADAICKDMNLSEYKRDLLSNYACKLHPKK